MSLATLRCRFDSSSSLIAVRIMAHSVEITPRSSAAVLQLRTARIKSRSFIAIFPKKSLFPTNYWDLTVYFSTSLGESLGYLLKLTQGEVSRSSTRKPVSRGKIVF